MEPQTARELRHNLRTPINHILGYTEMLIEDAREGGRREALEDLADIHDAAHESLSRVNTALAAGENFSQESLDDLRASLREPVDRILTCAESVRRTAPDWSADLGKIEAGAAMLLAMLGEAAPVSQPLPQQAAPAPPRAVAAARLLIVDDSEVNRDMLRRQLERQGYRISEASGGRQALEALRASRFDLVLLDIMMPEMDGFQVLAEMKNDAALRSIPVVVVSAVDEMKSIIRSIEMGAEDYLLKPFDSVLLRARVAASVEKQRLRNELVVREKLASLGALAAGIAHEIRNPLNFVTNFADISADLVREMREKIAGGDGSRDELLDLAADLEQNVLKIREHGGRADSVVASMLAHSRGQSGERRPTELNPLVAEAVNLAYHALRAQDPTFHVTILNDYDPAAGLVSAIPQNLSRAVLNVASNAFYAARAAPSPHVWVCTRDLGPVVEIRIRDNGPGVPQEIRSRIFDPFFTTKPAGEGTGLGLSLTYDIVVQEHKGELHVESEPGRGAEFVISLPREAE